MRPVDRLAALAALHGAERRSCYVDRVSGRTLAEFRTRFPGVEFRPTKRRGQYRVIGPDDAIDGFLRAAGMM